MASVWIQPKNGKYLVRWYVDDPKAEKSETFTRLGNTKTPGTAKHRELELKEQLAKGTYVDPKLQRQKLGAVVDKWVARANAETTEDLRQAFRNDLGELAGMWIGDLRAPHIRDWLDTLLKGRPWAAGKPLAPGTVKRRLDMLKTVLNQLVSDDLLTKSHAVGVKLPPIDAEVLPENLMTLEEAQIILQATGDARLKAMCHVAMKAGLRPAEIAGLRVRDVDEVGNTLSVMQQITRRRVPTNVLKTKTSRRIVAVPGSLIAELLPFMQERGVNDLLFTTANDKPYSSKDMGDWLHRREAKTDLSRTYTWRDFRHFYASCLISRGINVKTVQSAMGHANASITLNVYTHLWPNQDEATRSAVEEIWLAAA